MQVRDGIGRVKRLVPIGSLYEERPHSPCLMALVLIDPIQQLHGNAVVEELASYLQVR